MKKILSLVLALMLVLSMATTAFATTFEDVDADNKDLVDAASALNGLGIITGYDDGTFKPEKVVTRAEMAAMLIRARGYESIATDTPAFTDSQNHWAKGYISLASDLGIIEGRGNGIFDPDATVTFQEAAVMMLRALGYTNETINNGKSDAYVAANYRTKALSLGLFARVGTFTMNEGANRGKIAVMLQDNLTNRMVFTGENGRSVYDGTNILLDSIATIEPSFDVTITELGKGHLIDLNNYLYQNLVVYKNAEGKVVYIKDFNSTVYTGTLANNDDATKLNVNISASNIKEVTLADASSVTVFYNGAATTMTKANLVGKAAAKVVLTPGATPTVKGIIVEEINATKKVVNAYISGKTSFETFALPLLDGKVDFSKITVVGDATSLADIAKDDIIQVAKSVDGKVFKFYVTRNVVEGQVTEITAKTASGAISKLIINGVEYTLGTTLVGSDAVALGEEGLFYLNKAGQIVFFAADAVQTQYDYAIITGVANGALTSDPFAPTNEAIATYPKIQMIGMDGKKVVKELAVAINADGTIKTPVTGFTIADTTLATALTGSAMTAVVNTDNYVVKYSVNADGRITAVEAVTLTSELGEAVSKTGANFLATDSTVVLNLKDGAFSLTSLDNLKATVNYYAVGDAFAWDLLIVLNGVKTTNTGVYGVITKVTETLNASGAPVQKVEAFVDGVKVTYLTTGNAVVNTTTQVGKIVTLTTNTSGVLATVAGPTAAGTATPTAIVAGRIALSEVATSFKLDAEVLVYKQAADGTVSIGDMADVQFIFNEKVVELYDTDNNGAIDTIFIRK